MHPHLQSVQHPLAGISRRSPPFIILVQIVMVGNAQSNAISSNALALSTDNLDADTAPKSTNG